MFISLSLHTYKPQNSCLFFLNIILTTFGTLHFHMNLRNVLLSSKKNNVFFLLQLFWIYRLIQVEKALLQLIIMLYLFIYSHLFFIL